MRSNRDQYLEGKRLFALSPFIDLVRKEAQAPSRKSKKALLLCIKETLNDEERHCWWYLREWAGDRGLCRSRSSEYPGQNRARHKDKPRRRHSVRSRQYDASKWPFVSVPRLFEPLPPFLGRPVSSSWSIWSWPWICKCPIKERVNAVVFRSWWIATKI